MITDKIISLSLEWLSVNGFHIFIIFTVAFIAQRASGSFVRRVVERLVVRGDGTEQDEKKREETLIQIFKSALTIAIFTIAGLTLLSEVGIAIGPILAAAGIAGVAIGFGGQYLIRDVITGLFLIIENQYRVGDVVCFDKTCGLVESISLRMTELRDLEGTVHHVPHGEIKIVSNLSKEFARVNLNVGVSYSANIEDVEKVVNRIGKELAEDAKWKDKIIKTPEFVRIDDFADSAIVIKILGDTKPLEQWGVAGELRKRLKIAFDKAGIEIPFPQRVIHQSK
ncbi:MAG: potassium transporter KefA [Candidatus Yonathbacteria bacterium CG10_big_fil_rev_8_21_14_0_10_43_136]|uniref:Mechanosensitive ion channel family protein n=2 Tax=Parcubacteria group TaxID=1794811 RepID=A0A2M7Q4U0_9BACT|nr:MAG: potassium transporter KefA [Candidatus Nomurabacteria bacterium CG2_30_43_9]PIR40828.1 MAG: potassium transporter KefA [Candidatus Yonathbacteria bacterium CG10_big_fil_rev_8_21_14_0_10_43_136]PIX57202.1 MAG: mechanosensitive ion channel family protein [Candidatus Yonathbacteria bacterium CG_4_10_14_3_um_filter_43_12]PIY58428.1 MAG: mechanosensitive ion channel family protein [Candidatus Yonathbacteria bacterium CG_4_10_14_0_8_um_filter_43_17]PJC22130.1 MAG: mechanosensitive ion channel